MVFTDATWKYFSQIQFRVRSALSQSKSTVPFEYEDEPFFKSYNAPFCMFRIEMEKVTVEAHSTDDIGQLLKNARICIGQNQRPHALVYVNRIIEPNPKHLDALKLAGFIHFGQGDYLESLKCNETVLEMYQNDLYALKGKGLCLTRLENTAQGIDVLKQAVEKTSDVYMDPYYDLAIVLMEQKRLDDARKILDQGCEKSASFLMKARPLYLALKNRQHLLKNQWPQ